MLWLVDWWLRGSLPLLAPARPAPIVQCPTCLAWPSDVRRGDDAGEACGWCGRIPARVHALTVPSGLQLTRADVR